MAVEGKGRIECPLSRLPQGFTLFISASDFWHLNVLNISPHSKLHFVLKLYFLCLFLGLCQRVTCSISTESMAPISMAHCASLLSWLPWYLQFIRKPEIKECDISKRSYFCPLTPRRDRKWLIWAYWSVLELTLSMKRCRRYMCLRSPHISCFFFFLTFALI